MLELGKFTLDLLITQENLRNYDIIKSLSVTRFTCNCTAIQKRRFTCIVTFAAKAHCTMIMRI